MKNDLILEEVSESIIGAAMTVLNALRPGLDEKLYERALVIELKKEDTESLSSENSVFTTTDS